MPAIVEFQLARTEQAQIRLMDQYRRRQRAFAVFDASARETAQLVVQHFEHAAQRTGVAASRQHQQLGDLGHVVPARVRPEEIGPGRARGQERLRRMLTSAA